MDTVAAKIKADLIAGNYRITAHAFKRLNERKLTAADIEQCAWSAPAAILQDHGTYLLVGTDLEGKVMSVVAAYENGTLVVTVFPEEK